MVEELLQSGVVDWWTAYLGYACQIAARGSGLCCFEIRMGKVFCEASGIVKYLSHFCSMLGTVACWVSLLHVPVEGSGSLWLAGEG
jgi:hypothetical protein